MSAGSGSNERSRISDSDLDLRLAENREEERRRLLDLLVDGELDDERRRALFERLDAELDGWKQCALAFLEAQEWRQAFASPERAAFDSPTLPFPLPLAPLSASVPASSSTPKAGLNSLKLWGGTSVPAWRLGLAAAALLTAFVSGVAIGDQRRAFFNGESSDPGALAIDPGAVASNPNSNPPKAIASPPEFVNVGWNRPKELVFVPGAHPVDVPLDERWLRAPDVVVSPTEREEWRRMGYEVSETKRLISIQLENGQRVSIPLGEVKVKFVGAEYH